MKLPTYLLQQHMWYALNHYWVIVAGSKLVWTSACVTLTFHKAFPFLFKNWTWYYQCPKCHLFNSNMPIVLYWEISYYLYCLTCYQTFVGQLSTEYHVSYWNMHILFSGKSKSIVRITHFNKVVCYTSIFKFITEMTLSVYQSLESPSLSVWPPNDVNVFCSL